MTVMTASMHFSGRTGGIGKPSRLADRQRVHIGAQTYAPARGAIAQRTDDARPGETGGDRETQPGKLPRHDGARPLLLKPKLRVHVEIMADGAKLIAVTGNLFNDHRFWGT
jgi:hypothetical protein